MTPDQDYADRLARQVRCPNCGAAPGVRCTTRKPSGHHVRRADKAVVAQQRGRIPDVWHARYGMPPSLWNAPQR